MKKFSNLSNIMLILSMILLSANTGCIFNKCSSKENSKTSFSNSIGMSMIYLKDLDCWVGQYEVTQSQYEKIMQDNPSSFPGNNKPVENVTHLAAVEFCDRLTRLEHEAGLLPKNHSYQLPTESQWEYFVGDAKVDDAVFNRWQGTKALGTREVGSKKPNKFRLYDTRGNVWEWCSDWWNIKEQEHSIRGGSWDIIDPKHMNIDYRPVSEAALQSGNYGFRVVINPVR